MLEKDSLVEYALRQTLVADAVSLQFRLPPPGVPAPGARRSNAIAGGAPVVDALVITSVWAVHLLRTLSQVNITPVLFNAHWSLEEEGSAPVSKMNAAPAPSRGACLLWMPSSSSPSGPCILSGHSAR